MKINDHKKIIIVIGLIELGLGAVTLLSSIFQALFLSFKKPPNVLVFVLVTSVISVGIGFGLIGRRDWARKTLLYFSGYIIVTKLLVAADLVNFTGEMVTAIPQVFKDSVSFLYHSSLVFFLTRKGTDKIFS